MLDKNSHPDILNKNRKVSKIISEPRSTSADYEIIADEIADLVYSHTFKVHVDDLNYTCS
jgi:hypothetical protein